MERSEIKRWKAAYIGSPNKEFVGIKFSISFKDPGKGYPYIDCKE